MVNIQQQTNLKMMCSVTPCQRLPLLVKYEVGSNKSLDLEDQTSFLECQKYIQWYDPTLYSL